MQQQQHQQYQQQQHQQHQYQLSRLKQLDQQNDMLDQKNKQEIAQILRMVETDQQNKLKQSKFHHHPNCLYHLQHQQQNTQANMIINTSQNQKQNLTNMFAFKVNTHLYMGTNKSRKQEDPVLKSRYYVGG